jgi:peptide/nickel transport system permease protein
MKRFLNYLKLRPLGMASLVLLLILYLLMLFAEFIAPYSPSTSFADKTYHPPNVRFAGGKLQAQKAQAINTITWKYARVRGEYTPIRFFACGQPYKLWGLIPMERHLFTTGSGAQDGVYNSYPAFLMGADNLGRDLFSRIIYGSRISLTIGFIATFISLSLAILFGGLSGYFGGFTDWAIMRFSEFFMLIPGLYLILFLRSLLSSDMDSGQSYMMITLILSLVGWPGSARTIRGMVHAIKREEFVMNAQLEMIPPLVIIARHIIPQIASLLIVSIALSVPGFILTETTLSYLGLGIVDPAVSWGSLIRRDISTLGNLRNYPWLLAPVWFLVGVTLAFNFVGDALRDYYDPYHTIFPRFRRGRPPPAAGPRSRPTPTTGDTRVTPPDTRFAKQPISGIVINEMIITKGEGSDRQTARRDV